MPNPWGDEAANEWGDKPAQNVSPETSLDRVWAQPSAPKPLSTTETISGAIQRTGRGLVPGWTKMQAALDATAPAGATTPQKGDTWGERYKNNLGALDKLTGQFDTEHPWVSPALGIAGSVPSMLATSGLAGAAPATALGRIGQGARLGAGISGMYAAGDSRAQSAPQALLDMGGGMFEGTVAGGAIPAALEIPGAIGKAAPKLAPWLREFAGERNIKAAGGIQSDITRSRKQLGSGGVNSGRSALTEIGAEMGDKKLVGPFSTPSKTFERSADLMGSAGDRMGKILADADAAGGAKPELGNILSSGDEILANLKSNPHAASAADMFGGLLGKYRSIYGDGPLTFEQAHQIRTNISKDLYGMRGTKDPWADAYKDALHQLRGSVSDEIDRSLGAATSNTSAWKAANRDYQVASKALEFADKGIDRAKGNNQVSPTELVAALGGLSGGAAATGSPVGGGVGGLAAYLTTALARRHGSGMQGAAALRLSNALRGANPVTATATPETEALAATVARLLGNHEQPSATFEELLRSLRGSQKGATAEEDRK